MNKENNVLVMALAFWCSISGVHYMILTSVDVWGDYGTLMVVCVLLHVGTLGIAAIMAFNVAGGAWLLVFSMLPVGVYAVCRRKHLAKSPACEAV